MPAWPSGSVSTANLDAGSDSPAAARPDLKSAVDKLNEAIAARGAADGVAGLDATARLPLAQLTAVLPAIQGVFADTVHGSRTWTVPAGVTKVCAIAVGAGGGGAYVTDATGGDDGGGGGAGGIAEKIYTVVPGSVFDYTVGEGGSGKSNASDGDGNEGGDTQITSPASATPANHTITGEGGDKGYGPTNDRFGGTGRMGINGDINLRGGSGQSGTTRGGAGGGNAFCGGVAGAPKTDGFGGGGGGSGGPGGSGTAGYDGMNGAVVFRW